MFRAKITSTSFNRGIIYDFIDATDGDTFLKSLFYGIESLLAAFIAILVMLILTSLFTAYLFLYFPFEYHRRKK